MIVLFITETFYPPNNPRAIRAFEFVRQFLLDGFTVILLTKNKIEKKQLEKDSRIRNIENLQIFHYSNSNIEKTVIFNISNFHSNFFTFFNDYLYYLYYKFKKKFKKVVNCIYPFLKDYPLLRSLIQMLNEFSIEPQIIFANAWPVYIPLALCRAKRFNQKYKKVFKIVELSDPILENPTLCKYSPILKKIEFEIINYFDFFLFPNEKTANVYAKYKKVFKKMLVFPLTLSKELIQISSYSPNPIPTFAYAGSFYYDIRNPSFLFNFLLTYRKPFKFFFFGDLKNADNLFFLKKFYPKLSGKLIVRDSIDVYKLIKHLSKMDFLVNLENLSSVQIPSKNYIYMLAKRPVISFNEKTFSSSDFSYILDNWKKIDLNFFDKIWIKNHNKLLYTEDIWKDFVSLIFEKIR